MPDHEGRLTHEEFREQGRAVARQIALREELVQQAREEREDERHAAAEFERAPAHEQERLRGHMRDAFDRVVDRVAARREALAGGDPDNPHARYGERLSRREAWGDLIKREVLADWWRDPRRTPNPTHPATTRGEE